MLPEIMKPFRAPVKLSSTILSNTTHNANLALIDHVNAHSIQVPVFHSAGHCRCLCAIYCITRLLWYFYISLFLLATALFLQYEEMFW